MGCSTSRDAAALLPCAPPSRRGRERQRRRGDPAKLCRERAALVRTAADRRSALAAAHAAYFRSLGGVGGAFRCFAAAALAAPAFALPPSPPLSANLGGHNKPSSSTTTTRRRVMMRSSATVPTVVFEDPYARPQYTEGEARYGYVYGEESPSPPPWDFLDPFAHCEGFVEDYYSRRSQLVEGGLDSDHKTRRRMEGIPELEEETESSSKRSSSRAAGDQQGKAKTSPNNVALNGDPSGANNNGNKGKTEASKPSNGSSTGRGGTNATSSSSSTQNKKKPVSGIETEQPNRPSTAKGEGRGGESSAAASTPLSPMRLGAKRSVTAAMDEAYWLFTEAANRGAAVARALGNAKAVSTRRAKLRVLVTTVSTSSCLPNPRGRKTSASRSRRSTSASAASLLPGAGRRNDVHGLSSTLDKLWVCEKKLYREIKDKEKLRKQYKRMLHTLKSLDQRGAETDSTQLSLLRSKIRICTSTANVLSRMIERIRDEELYPQLADLVTRFRSLWKAVSECHEKQLSAVLDTEIHRLKAATTTLMSQSSAAAPSAASEELERELKNWRRCFDTWIGAQRSFVEALHSWMKKWRLPEVDAPQQSAFVVSNEWL
ncbi:hypothetical protein QOZ80_5BG0441040 [Eleusine coracana subsp. coracana]|nr:hypothetical protein QOZ80_5BG0441040 [Eleusine coracana subsp. coracana]